MEETTISTKILHKGKFLDFVEHQVKINVDPPQVASRQFFVHPGGVCVLPILDNQRLILVKQYRKAVDKILIEIPAGKIDQGDLDTLVTAQRELQEETGYIAKTWIDWGVILPCPGYSTELLYLYIAKDLEQGKQNLDEGEFVEIIILNYSKALAMIDSKEIIDSKTINAIFLAQKYF